MMVVVLIVAVVMAFVKASHGVACGQDGDGCSTGGCFRREGGRVCGQAGGRDSGHSELVMVIIRGGSRFFFCWWGGGRWLVLDPDIPVTISF